MSKWCCWVNHMSLQHNSPSKHTTSQGRLQYVSNWSVRPVLNGTSSQRPSDVPTTSHTDVLTTSIGRCVFLRGIHLNRSKGWYFEHMKWLIFLTYEIIWIRLQYVSIWLVRRVSNETSSQRLNDVRRTRNVSRRRLNDVDRTLCVLHYMFLIDGYNCWQRQNKGLVDLLNTWHSLNTP